METVEMDLMQAQIGSLATDVSRLEAKVAAGGGGGTGGKSGVGVITTVYSGNDQYIYECTNPGALQYVFTKNDDSMSPLFYDNIQETTFDFTSDMNVVTFNEDGSTVPYVGHKNVISLAAPRLYYNEGFQALSGIILFDGNMSFDMDTGKAIYITLSD